MGQRISKELFATVKIKPFAVGTYKIHLKILKELLIFLPSEIMLVFSLTSHRIHTAFAEVKSQGDMGVDGFGEGVRHLHNRNHKPKCEQTGPSLECTTCTPWSKQEKEKLRHVRRRAQKAHKMNYNARHIQTCLVKMRTTRKESENNGDRWFYRRIKNLELLQLYNFLLASTMNLALLVAPWLHI